jgi:myo-inositol-1(or 4)-monophosphatase
MSTADGTRNDIPNGTARGATAAVDELRALAEELARRAGSLALAGRKNLAGGAVVHDTKSTPTDPVTEFDRAAERVIVDELRRRRPDDSIVGEEGAGHQGSSGLAWHLDPIDGTVNFVYGLAAWATSIGVLDADGGVAGAVYVPATGEMFSAARGRGATLDGSPIRCTAPVDLATSLIGTGFSYSPATRAAQGERLASLLPRVRDVRRSGSAAIDLCSVACGRLDAYFEEHLNSWDLAAGLVICTEAGAASSDFSGGAARPAEVVVAAPTVHDELLATLRAIDG